MRILFLTNLIPFPLDNGGKIKTFNTLKMLSDRYKIDLLCYYEDESELEYKEELLKYCKDVIMIKKPIVTSKNYSYMIGLAFKSLFSKNPLTMIKFYDEDLGSIINGKLKSNIYSYIYYDHLQLAIFNKSIRSNTLRVLDQHNCESFIIKGYYKAERNIIKKIFFLLEYFKVRNFEKNIISSMDKLILLSDEDMKSMECITEINKSKVLISPIVVEGSNYIKEINEIDVEKPIKILFLGTMSWYPNSEGVKWFINEVIPELNEKINSEIYIVGKGVSEEIVNTSKKYKNINILGYVENVNDVYDICDCMVVPIFTGSGLRVKIIEAFSKGFPVISTLLGAEGLDAINHKNIIIANNKSEMIQSIKELKESYVLRKKISDNAYKTYRDKYSFNGVKNRLLDFLDKE